MYPLIEITTVPIEMEIKTTRAKFEVARGTAEMEVSQNDRGVQIKSRSVRLNLDTFQASNVVMPKQYRGTATQRNEVSAPKTTAQATTYDEATVSFRDQTSLLVNGRLAQNRLAEVTQATSDVATGAANAGEWDQGEMSIRYDMDKLNFDWNQSKNLTFVPGDVEISIKQQADLIIKYVGGIVYVPPSADPNYEPVDVKA